MNIKETRIADIRLDNDLTQKDVALKINVKEDTYSKWERGINDIPLDNCNDIVNLYNSNFDYILGLGNDDSKSKRQEIDYKLLSKRLYEIRKENNLSQEKLSNDIGIHQRAYSYYESGERIPTTFKLLYIAVYYKVSFDYLVGRSDNKKIK